MSAELKDFRGKITAETDAWLRVKERRTGRDRSDLVREILHRHVLHEIEEASVLMDQMESQGLRAARRGASGSGLPQSGSKR